MKLYVKKLSPLALLPQKAHPGDTGWDLFNAGEGVFVPPLGKHIFPTGISATTESGWFIKIESRSGLAAGPGATLLCGVIDRGFKNELGVVLHNTDPGAPLFIAHGEKIAQMVILPLPDVEMELVEELPEVDTRGMNGFGSSGKFST